MAIPQIETIQNRIQKGKLELNFSLIPHHGFKQLLDYLHIPSLMLDKATVVKIPQNGHILISGNTDLNGLNINDFVFVLYESEAVETGFEIEWTGELDQMDLDWLFKYRFLLPHYMNQLLNSNQFNFKNISIHYTSDDNDFFLSSDPSSKEIKLPEINLSLQRIGFNLSIHIGEEISRIFKLESIIKMGSTAFPVSVQLPVGEFKDSAGWIVQMDQMVHLKSAFQDVFTFLDNNPFTKETGGDHLKGVIPESFLKFGDFAISEFYLQFDPLIKTLHLLKLKIESLRTIELFEKFTIQEAGIEINISYTNDRAILRLILMGSFQIGDELFASIDVVLPSDPDQDWQVNLDGGIDLEKIDQLEAFPFFKISDLQLPTGWLQAKEITVETLRFVFNPAKRKVKSVELAMYMDASASLIPGITGSDPYVRINLNFE